MNERQGVLLCKGENAVIADIVRQGGHFDHGRINQRKCKRGGDMGATCLVRGAGQATCARRSVETDCARPPDWCTCTHRSGECGSWCGGAGCTVGSLELPRGLANQSTGRDRHAGRDLLASGACSKQSGGLSQRAGYIYIFN